MDHYIVQTTPEGGSNGSKIIQAELVQPFGNGIAFYAYGKLVACFTQYVACAKLSATTDGTIQPGED